MGKLSRAAEAEAREKHRLEYNKLVDKYVAAYMRALFSRYFS